MAQCFYYKNGERINDIQDIIEAFFKENFSLKNAAIFSADEIQESTKRVLLNLPGALDYDKFDGDSVTTFISKEQPGLFNKIGIETKTGRLTPEYILENRIIQFIKDGLNRKDIVQLPDNADVSGIPYSTEMFDKIRASSELGSTSDAKVITLLSEIEDIIKFEDLTKDFGNFLHKMVSKRALGSDITGDIAGFIKNPKNAEIVGTGDIKDWNTKIADIVDEILTTVRRTGLPISEIVLFSKEGSAINVHSGKGIKGKIDLIAIDKAGDAHIFEIKISKTNYKDWDSAKRISLDWQLAMYRQLLGQHININKTMLYVIPVWIQDLGNPAAISVQKFANRKTENAVGLGNGQEITRRADLLIPRGVFGTYDPKRIEDLKNDLSALIPDYIIKTGIEDYDVEKIMENARKRYEKEKVWKKWNNFDDIPGIKQGYIEEATEEEFRARIEDYVKHVKELVNKNVSILKDAIISAIKTGTNIKTNAYDSGRDITTNHLLKEYLTNEWDVVDSIPEALPMGLIVLKNRRNGNINIISLSINQFYADSNLKGLNYGDLEILKSYLFINALKDDLFPGGYGKVAQILVYNPANNQVYNRDSYTKFTEFKEQMYRAKLEHKLTLTLNDNISGIEDIAIQALDANWRKFDGSGKKEVDEIFGLFRDTNLDDIDVDQLLDIQKAFYRAFPDYKNKTMEGKLNFEDPKEVLLAQLQVALISKSQLSPTGDFQRLSKYSLGFSDFKSLIAILYTDNQAKYDKDGQRIQGMVQGLLWTTPDWVASKDLKNINQIMSTGNQHVGETMVKVSEQIYAHTKEFYKASNFGNLERNTVGESQSKHKNMWYQKNGQVADEFRTKNPYLEDTDNTMEDHERKYLKEMLFAINRWSLEIPDKEAEAVDISTLESITKHPLIKAAIESGKYFNMPLVRREEITRFKGMFNSAGKLWQDKIKPYMHEINDYLDGRELSVADLDIIEKQKMGFYEMFDVYGRHTPEYVSRGIEKHGVDYFEWNLDTIAHRVAFNKIRKRVFDKKLPIINAYVWWIKLLAGKENENISNQLQYIADQMSLSIYDEPIIDKEFKDYAVTAAVVKRMSTAAMLAFKPASLMKEMTIGVFKGISLAATQIYGKDQFTITDLAAAYKKLMTIDNKFASEFNLIDRLNQHYRFANMDVNTIAKKLQTDRRGVLKGVGRYMYMCNTVPDYYNRLSIFLAKMIHDGSYEAHTLTDGVFNYDPRKDKRFEYYLAIRSKYLKDGEYQVSKDDVQYNTQRRRYKLLQQQLNAEYKGEQEFKEEDLVPKAYSEIERTSMKSFTDMAYGYYDKDAQSQANNTWWGMTWLQFMQFWPGKMKMWFANPTDESPMGKVVHDYIIDANGNKILQYFKTVEQPDGSFRPEPTDEDTGDPVLKWEGTPYEGLYYSLVGTIKDIVKLDFKKVKGAEERNRRAIFALADAGLIFMMLAIAKALLEGIIAENGTEGLSGSLLNMTAAVNRKVLNEYNVWNSTLGAPQSTPVFLSWGKKTARDTWSAISGDKDIMDVVTQNVGAAEVFKW